jgi:type IV pilus assembly protein PilY1
MSSLPLTIRGVWRVDTGNTKNVPVDKQKMTLLKQSLKAQFGNGTANSGKVPDKRIRLAWQTMHNNGSAPGAESLTPGKENAMRSFEGKHRVNFNTFVDSLNSKKWHPLAQNDAPGT